MPSQIIGDEELKRKLRKLTDLSFLRPHIQASVVHLSGKVSDYPPATAANSPNAQGRWYSRGFGQKWTRRDGSIGGRATSEDLGPSWKGKVTSNTRGVIGNDASYATFVQGPNQSSVMRDIGWRTTDTVVEEESAFVLSVIQRAVERELNK